jgi:hypothetical protein
VRRSSAAFSSSIIFGSALSARIWIVSGTSCAMSSSSIFRARTSMSSFWLNTSPTIVSSPSDADDAPAEPEAPFAEIDRAVVPAALRRAPAAARP